MRRRKHVQGFFIPEVDTGLDADLHIQICESSQQVLLRQEAFVNKVDIFHALLDQGRHLVDYDASRPPAVLVAKILFGTERAAMRTTPGCLHFRARPFRGGFKSVMMMRMAS